jgi:hypothetical protein
MRVLDILKITALSVTALDFDALDVILPRIHS